MADQVADPNQGCKIVVYWLEQSRAQRIIWLLEELNLKYELRTYKRGKDMLAPKELRDIHPLGKSPVISITGPSGGTPKVIAESAVIVEYISKHFGPQLIPAEFPEGRTGPGEETEEWSRYRFFMHYAEGSIMPPLLIALAFMQLKGPKVPFLIRPLTRTIANQVDKEFLNQEFAKQFSFLESQLESSSGDYLCGPNLTGADIMMIYPLQGAILGKFLDKTKYPKVGAYVDRLEALENWKKAVTIVEEKTGDKFSLAPGLN